LKDVVKSELLVAKVAATGKGQIALEVGTWSARPWEKWVNTFRSLKSEKNNIILTFS
jgi:hypothetical protein